jgi:hypothetical protein
MMDSYLKRVVLLMPPLLPVRPRVSRLQLSVPFFGTHPLQTGHRSPNVEFNGRHRSGL